MVEQRKGSKRERERERVESKTHTVIIMGKESVDIPHFFRLVPFLINS